MIKIARGLDLPIEGEPAQTIDSGPRVQRVALLGDDYVGMKPTMAVETGDRVRLGQLLFTDKKNPGVRLTSPGSGTVVAINRGAKRRLDSVVIELDGEDEETFTSHEGKDLSALKREEVRDNLVASGLWTALRTRPFSKVPPPDSVPHSIFVTAMDTNPLAAKVDQIINEDREGFVAGLQILSRLTEGSVFVCKEPGAEIPGNTEPRVSSQEFNGPHPAGLPGTHIHFLDPVGEKKTVWHINYQDTIAVGNLFLSGRLSVERVISLAGPVVSKPRLIRTRLGADIEEIVSGELQDTGARVISGSVLSGREATGARGYLGRYHLQVSVIAEGRERELFNWMRPGFNRFSVTRVFASALQRKRKVPFTTSSEGSRRAMVPIGTFEKVMPLDILPTFLLRELIVGNTEKSRALGCLELDEEDVALSSFVCPGKYVYGPILRSVLTTIEREG